MTTAIRETEPTEAEWRPDWEAIADRIVRRTLRVSRGERVVFMADPLTVPGCFEAVREAVWEVGAIEHATILNWTPRLMALRSPAGTSPDPAAAVREAYAHSELLAGADIFMWLPTDHFYRASVTRRESEWILGRWSGRGLHCHWFPDPAQPRGHPIHRELERIYERAILQLDYEAHARRQRAVVDAIRGRTLRVTTPDGTELRFRCPTDGWYHLNDGDQSPEKARRAICARDREEELPCGAVRTIPAEDSVEGVVSLRRVPGWNGRGIELAKFGEHLDLVFRGGRITELRGGARQAELDAERAWLHGDWDRLGEIVIGTNPLLETPSGAAIPTYWGFGEGVFRAHLGDNLESSGRFESNLWLNVWLTDATIEANGETIVRDGRLLIPMP
jgi:leucyl aminopeptidase (aminopeptidase T)